MILLVFAPFINHSTQEIDECMRMCALHLSFTIVARHFCSRFPILIHDSFFRLLFASAPHIHHFMILLIFFHAMRTRTSQNMFVKFYYNFFKRLFIEKKLISFDFVRVL